MKRDKIQNSIIKFKDNDINNECCLDNCDDIKIKGNDKEDDKGNNKSNDNENDYDKINIIIIVIVIVIVKKIKLIEVIVKIV